MTYDEANNAVLNKHKSAIVLFTSDLKDSYIVAVAPKNLKNGQISLDSFFKVNKKTKKITEYSPVMDPEEFKKALNSVVYKK